MCRILGGLFKIVSRVNRVELLDKRLRRTHGAAVPQAQVSRMIPRANALPPQLDMNDGDTLEVHKEQIGGALPG